MFLKIPLLLKHVHETDIAMCTTGDIRREGGGRTEANTDLNRRVSSLKDTQKT